MRATDPASGADVAEEFARRARLDEAARASPPASDQASDGGDSDDDAILRRMVETRGAAEGAGDEGAVGEGDGADGAVGEDAPEATVEDGAVPAAVEEEAREAPVCKPKKARRRRKDARPSGEDAAAPSASFRERFAGGAGPRGARDAGDDLFACKVCGMDFTSRTQLFKHIKKTGHAALKT